MSGENFVAVEVWTLPEEPLMQQKYYENADCIYCFEGLNYVRMISKNGIEIELKRVGEIGGE